MSKKSSGTEFHLAIDGTQMIQPTLRGVRRYVSNLIRFLICSGEDLDITVFYNTLKRKNADIGLISNKSIKVCRSNLPGRVLNWWWNFLPFPPIDLFIGNHDVFHAPSIHSVPPTTKHLVSTVHDLVPVRFPEYYTKDYLKEYERRLKAVRKRADAIITVSESTKEDIVSFMGYNSQNIFVIPEAPTPDLISNNSYLEKELVLKKLKLGQPYLLYVGGGEPHKNISTLVKAFSILKSETKAPHKLVLVGESLVTNRDILDLISGYSLEGDVIFTGYVPDQDLAIIYEMADAFVFLSLYEGFGLVLLEAMKFGVPVVASKTSSIPEVVGDDALLVDPHNVREVKGAIMNIIEDKELASELHNRSINRASRFSWESTVQQTIRVYQSLIG